jgi:crossover junction endodeoxyribonuclease RuvC
MNTGRYFLGIDPGKAGGVCSLGDTGDILTVSRMPDTESDIADWFASWSQSNCFAVIEKVHSFPGQGVASSFTFGRGYGGLRMALICHGIPFEEVTPRVWQKALGITKRRDSETKGAFKNRLKGKAQELFPSEKVTLATADALLIAEYCRRKMEGIL